MPSNEWSGQNLESQRSRELIDKLREHGLDKHIPLPQVVIMGDTSSGKSSVISALSGITFPSSDQLTTRCPTQLSLTNAKEFSGTVSLKRYKPQPNEKIKSANISTIGEITEHITNLTQLLVNEGQNISDDCIVITVAGPQFPNLTLTDLPGLVRAVETGEDKRIIERVQKLVYRYLEQTRTVILAVIPANVDLHNIEIITAAEDVDPNGIRTVAIITKPDLIDEGGEQAVVDLLLNKRKKFKLGYHIVKCRGQKHLNDGVSIQDGIEKEIDYFQNSAIWSKLLRPELMGINNLRMKLVSLLEEIILRELPNVIEDIDIRKSKCQEKLIALGQPMDTNYSRRNFYINVIDSYYGHMESAIGGEYKNQNSSIFFQECYDPESDNRFRALVGKMDREFQRKVANSIYEEDYVPITTLNHKVGTHIKAVSPNDEVWFGTIEEINGKLLSVRLLDDSCKVFDSTKDKIAIKNFDKIKKMMESNKGDEITIFPSYKIFTRIVENYIRTWKKPMLELFEYYEKTMLQVSQRAVEIIECKTTVKHHLQFTVSNILEKLKESTYNELSRKVESSAVRPFTLDHCFYDNLLTQRNRPLIEYFKTLNKKPGTIIAVATVLAILEKHGVEQTSNEDHVAIETEYAVIAYLKLASKRFIDEVPVILNDFLLSPFLKEIKKELQIITDDDLAKMLVESQRIIQNRKRIMEEEESLTKSKEEVKKFHLMG